MRGDAANDLIAFVADPNVVHSGIEGADRQHRAGAQKRGAAARNQRADCRPRSTVSAEAARSAPGAPTSPNAKHGQFERPQKRRRATSDVRHEDSSPTRRSASAAKRVKSPASSGINCPTTASFSRGMSYDNTVHSAHRRGGTSLLSNGRCRWANQDAGDFSWLFSSDVCKHCARAGCLESCPTGAIIRTEFDSRLRSARYLQRLRLLCGELPVRSDRPPRRRRSRVEVHALLRPSERRYDPGLRQGVSHGIHPIRRAGNACASEPASGSRSFRSRDDGSLPVRHRKRINRGQKA